MILPVVENVVSLMVSKNRQESVRRNFQLKPLILDTGVNAAGEIKLESGSDRNSDLESEPKEKSNSEEERDS